MPITIPPSGFGSTHHTAAIVTQGELRRIDYYCGPDAVDVGEGQLLELFCGVRVTTAVDFYCGQMHAVLQPGVYTVEEIEQRVLAAKTA